MGAELCIRDSLEAMIMDKEHALEPKQLAKRMNLPPNWDFDFLFELILHGQSTADEIDQFIHRDIH